MATKSDKISDRLDGETLDDIGRIIFELDRLADEDERTAS